MAHESPLDSDHGLDYTGANIGRPPGAECVAAPGENRMGDDRVGEGTAANRDDTETSATTPGGAGGATVVTRRSMLGYLGATAALAVVGGGASACDDDDGKPKPQPTPTPTVTPTPTPAEQRRLAARDIRFEAAEMAYSQPLPPHLDNGDEALYPNKIGSYSKAFPHNELGEVDLDAYNLYLTALETGTPAAFAAIPLGGSVKQANPQGGLAFDLIGPDSHALFQPPAPTFASAEIAGEMVELYWMALCRDVNFADYESSALIADACADLSSLSDFRGPKQNGQVTPATVFRGSLPSDLVGPYISQFLLRDFMAGSLAVVQRQQTPVPGSDFMTEYTTWLAIQNGKPPTVQPLLDPVPRFIIDLRGLARYVELDFSYEAFLHAALILQQLRIPVQDGNPYKTSTNQGGFTTWGGPNLLDLVAVAANCALRAVWFQKWFVHRRLRPEEYGGCVDLVVRDVTDYPVNSEVLESEGRAQVQATYGSSLLPMAYPGGCPTHPSYGAGHNAIAGACVTILKGWYKEDALIPNPKVPNADGTALVDYTGPDVGQMTVLNELDKLAGNFTQGRDCAGVHWRSDGPSSLDLGEAVAIGILQENAIAFNEGGSMTITKFDGTKITI